MPWKIGDPWPGTAGGAARIEWGGYTRVYLQAQIASGKPLRAGPDPNDSLDSGNVLADASFVGRASSTSLLWVDITCDLIDLEVTLGSSAGAGILSKSEAGTLVATLHDPDGKYDPLNPSTPFAIGGRTRLAPGVAVRCWAEVIRNPAAATPNVFTYALFWGSADRWSEPWVRDPGSRVAKLVASDPTKTFVRFDKPALPSPIGAGEGVLSRLNRIAANYGWTGSVQAFGNPIATLQGTTMAQTAWEQVGRTAQDELGFAYFIPAPPTQSTPSTLAMVAREVWNQRPAPSITIGCGSGMFDIATDVVPASFDDQLKNAAYVSRTGGTQQTAKVQSSIDRFWEQSIERSDLGLYDDAQAALWASTIVTLYAYPQTSIDTMTLRPDLAKSPWLSWQLVLGKGLISGLIRVVWDSAGYTIDTQARLVGWQHKITADSWEVDWRTVSASVASSAYTLHAGPHAQDQLDAGYVLA